MNRAQFLTTTSAAACALALAPACALLEDAEMRLCTLAEAEAAGKPVFGKFNRHQVMFTRLGDAWVAFSLTCSHKRCTVAWQPAAQEFACPCHEGRYDAVGNVIDGPPPAPLRRFRHEIRNGEVWLLNEWA